MLCSESCLVLRFLESIVDRLEALVIADVLDERLNFSETSFHTFQLFAGASVGAVNVFNLRFKISVLEKIILSEKVESTGSFFEVVELRPMLVALAFLSLDAVLNVNYKRETFSPGLHLTLARIASLNAFFDAFFGVILTDCFRTSETLLTFGSEGNVLAGFNFVTGFLHHFQELIAVLCSDDTPVNGLLELLFPARSSFGFRVFLVVHTLALRRRNNR